jgi:hypothetical protein
MQLSDLPTIKAGNASYWAGLARVTRTFGYCYVHASKRAHAWTSCQYNGIVFTYSGYGRSLAAGGHKYKVHARYFETGKPVPSKVLDELNFHRSMSSPA